MVAARGKVFAMKMATTRERWESLVKEYQAGSRSQERFARAHGVGVFALRYWIRKLKRDFENVPEEVRLVPVEIERGTGLDQQGVIEVFHGESKLVFNGPNFVEDVVRLLVALRRAGC